MDSEHISNDELEGYCLGKVSKPECARVEEHISWCDECLDRLECTSRIIIALQRDVKEHWAWIE